MVDRLACTTAPGELLVDAARAEPVMSCRLTNGSRLGATELTYTVALIRVLPPAGNDTKSASLADEITPSLMNQVVLLVAEAFEPTRGRALCRVSSASLGRGGNPQRAATAKSSSVFVAPRYSPWDHCQRLGPKASNKHAACQKAPSKWSPTKYSSSKYLGEGPVVSCPHNGCPSGWSDSMPRVVLPPLLAIVHEAH
jgi:hypothetical protein